MMRILLILAMSTGDQAVQPVIGAAVAVIKAMVICTNFSVLLIEVVLMNGVLLEKVVTILRLTLVLQIWM